MRDRQFKSQFETGTTKGSKNLAERRDIEHEVLGVPLNTPPHQRPIYGALGLAPAMPLLTSPAGYGPATFIMKPGVKDRATYTLGDSVDRYAREAYPWGAPGIGRKANNIYPYIEAQISRMNQPLTLDDVEHLLIANSNVSAAGRGALDKLGIPYDVMPAALAARPDSAAALDWWRQFGLVAPPLTAGGLWLGFDRQP